MSKYLTKQEIQQIRQLSKEGKTQKEIGTIMGIRQSTVCYQLSPMSRKKRRNNQKAKYKIHRCGGIEIMMVVFKRNGELYMTSEENYNAYIEDVSKTTSLRDFDTFEQVVEYMCRYSKAVPEQFIDKTGA